MRKAGRLQARNVLQQRVPGGRLAESQERVLDQATLVSVGQIAAKIRSSWKERTESRSSRRSCTTRICSSRDSRKSSDSTAPNSTRSVDKTQKRWSSRLARWRETTATSCRLPDPRAAQTDSDARRPRLVTLLRIDEKAQKRPWEFERVQFEFERGPNMAAKNQLDKEFYNRQAFLFIYLFTQARM